MMKKEVQLGLKENWKQFTILIIVNAFVGGMVGMERTIFPKFAEEGFGVSSNTAILSFITAFGITKALANYFTGRLADRFGRKMLLVAGWVIALPVPFILIHADLWAWVIFANVLLGMSQGLTWSSTVVMKIDLVGDRDRGLAMGLNEFAGYLAVGVVAFLTGYIAQTHGVTPYPFYLGIGMAVAGLLLSLIFVRDTRHHVAKEASGQSSEKMDNVFMQTTFRDRTLSSVTQAGLVNNLNDGMIWGLLPILLISLSYETGQIGIITAVYPLVWGAGQLFTGRLADLYNKKMLLFIGMLLQGVAILLLPIAKDFYAIATLAALLGAGTALVYPTFLAAIAEAAPARQRAESIGTFRLWRDLGYAFGAVLSGVVADLFGVPAAIMLIGAITVGSAIVIHFRMPAMMQPARECVEPEDVQRATAVNGSVLVIDVRSREEFETYHIPGAMHIALAELRDRVSELRKEARLITVCAKGGGRSADGARLLRELGYTAEWLCGGTEKWRNLQTI
jgi:MFS family permease/rhodanese-related sulfurtransferase